MEPDFELTDVPPESNRSTAGKLLTILAISVAVPLVLAGVGVWAWTSFVFPASDRGTCLASDPAFCISLSASTVEDIGSVVLPDGAEVIGSGSETGLQSGRAWGLVKLPANQDLQLGAGYVDVDATNEVPTFGSGDSFLEAKGFTALNSVSMKDYGPKSYRKVYFGSNAAGERLAYILRWQEYPGGLFEPDPVAAE
ncbi:hypothetical protein ACXR2T_05865 [Leucobacter sp. HY1910]